MTDEDDDYIVDLDLPPEWTDEEIRGVRKFCEILLTIAHKGDHDKLFNEIQRVSLNGGPAVDRLNLLHKPKPRKRLMPGRKPTIA